MGGGPSYNATMHRLSKYELLAVTASIGMGLILAYGPDGGALRRFESTPASAFDPKMGIPVKLPEADLTGRPITAKHTLLVLAGSCTGCALDALPPSRLTVPKDWQIVIVYSSDPKHVPKSMRNFPDPIRIVADPSSRLDIQLNATWHPRWYVLNAESRLITFARRRGGWPEGVTYAP